MIFRVKTIKLSKKNWSFNVHFFILLHQIIKKHPRGVGEYLRNLHLYFAKLLYFRDIKLENLLIDANQEIKLCDLGSCTTIVHNPTQVSWQLYNYST